MERLGRKMPAHSSLATHAELWPRWAFLHFCVLRFALCVLTFFAFLPAGGLVLSEAQAPRGGLFTPAPPKTIQPQQSRSAVGRRRPGGTRTKTGSAATGFLINEDGYLITNRHVVEAAKGCLEKAPGAKILAKLTIVEFANRPGGAL